METYPTPTSEDIAASKLIWDYCKLDHAPRHSDIILVMGTPDLLPAERGADIYLDGWADYLVFSGGVGGRNSEKQAQGLECLTEAEIMANVAVNMGVSDEKIILETKAKNSGQNVEYTKLLIAELGINVSSLIAVHMPYAHRRDLATIKKKWPEVDAVMCGPRVPFEKYHIRGFQGRMTQEELICDMLGDFQRTFVFAKPEFGFMVSQKEPVPENVKLAYNELVQRGYTQQLLKDKEEKLIEI